MELRRAVAACAALVAATSGCAGRDAAETRLSIATGGTGGVYYVYGGALAGVLSRRVPGVSATAEVTSASAENVQFVADGTADLAFTLADTAADAAAGRGAFPQALPLQVIAVLYRNATHVVVPEGSAVKALGDLAGKRVSTGSPGSGTELIAARLLAAAGVTTFTRERVGVSESAGALKDGRLDAFFWSGGLPTAAVLDLASSTRVRLVPHVDLLPALEKEHGPLYERLHVPASTYPGAPAADVVGVWNLLVTRRDLDEELAYRITRALFEGRDDLAAAHPAARELEPRTASRAVGRIELHPGARRYYREVGALAP